MGVGGDDWREFGERESSEVGEGGVGGGEVGGVVERGRAGDRVRRVGGWGEHRGGVGLDEEAVERDLLEEFAETGVARGEVGGVEREVGAERGEGRDEFEGAAVGVEEKTTGRERDGSEGLEEEAEGVDAVDCDRAVQSDGEGELGLEDIKLLVDWGATEAGEAGIVGAGAV